MLHTGIFGFLLNLHLKFYLIADIDTNGAQLILNLNRAGGDLISDITQNNRHIIPQSFIFALIQ